MKTLNTYEQLHQHSKNTFFYTTLKMHTFPQKNLIFHRFKQQMIYIGFFSSRIGTEFSLCRNWCAVAEKGYRLSNNTPLKKFSWHTVSSKHTFPPPVTGNSGLVGTWTKPLPLPNTASDEIKAVGHRISLQPPCTHIPRTLTCTNRCAHTAPPAPSWRLKTPCDHSGGSRSWEGPSPGEGGGGGREMGLLVEPHPHGHMAGTHAEFTRFPLFQQAEIWVSLAQWRADIFQCS